VDKMAKDIHGLVNCVIGTTLAIFGNLYSAEIPLAVLVVIGVSSFVLITRECWVLGGRLKWSMASTKTKE
jgi:hypothetical protein